MDLSLFDEKSADTIVKAVMLLHNKDVIIIKKGNEFMSVVLFKDEDGQVKRALNFEQVSREEIVEKVDQYQNKLTQWQDALEDFDRLTAETEEPAPTAEPSPELEQPAQPEPTPEQPAAPSPEPETPTAEPEAPVEPQPVVLQ